MYLGRVEGRVVCTQRYASPRGSLAGIALQWLQPLDEDGRDMGPKLVAATVISSGPGDVVHWIDGREAAVACPDTFVPVDATILGWVESAVHENGRDLAQERR